MVKAIIAIKLNQDVAKKFKSFCRDRGIKYGFFVEEAIKQKMELEGLKEDILDFKVFKKEESQAISFEDYLRNRRA